MVAKEIEEIASEVEEFVFKNKLSGEVQVSSDERGAIITISDVVLFPAGQARMTLPGKKKLKQVFDLLKQFDYNVKIEGHTDNSPIRTEKFPSNWELSAARASEVVRMLIAEGYPPEKLSVEGFAEFRPKASNNSMRTTSEVEEFVFKNKLSGEVQVSSDERGAIITISDVVLFPAGQARMTLPGKKKLKQVFDLLKQFDYNVKIEGHTDNSPIRTEKFPSNWELSAARASEVVRMLIAEGYPPEKLSVEGFAEFRPKASNNSPENRAINRRIEIVYQRGSIRKRMVHIINRKSTAR